jgi:hypothetical protein
MASISVISGSTEDIGRQWDELHEAAGAAPFAGRPWLELIAELFDRSIDISILTKNNVPVAGIPLCKARRGPFTISPPLPISLYSGCVVRQAYEELTPLIAAIERRCNFCVLQLPPGMDAGIFAKRGWIRLTQRSRILDIRDYDRLWSGYSQSLRRKVRRAEERAYACVQQVTPEQMLLLYQKSYQRHGIKPPIEVELMKRWINYMLRRPDVRVYGMRTPDGTVPAFRMVLRSGDRCFDWLAGSEDVQTYPAASHWLLNEVLRRESKAGSGYFDFMGTNTYGVSDFKELFGGEDISYQQVSWYRPAFLRGAEIVRNRLVLRRRGLR